MILILITKINTNITYNLHSAFILSNIFIFIFTTLQGSYGFLFIHNKELKFVWGLAYNHTASNWQS